MARISVTEEEAMVIFEAVVHVSHSNGLVLDKLYRKMSAALTNQNTMMTRMLAGADPLTYKDVFGPLTRDPKQKEES